METQTGFAPVHGGRLYYEVAGNGPALLLIHAGVADLRMWDEQVAHFAPRYRVIRYDTRGFGRTTSDNVAFSNRQDIVDLLDHLSVARTAVLGLSRGGHIALDFTLEHPDRVTALIVVAGGVSGFDFNPPPEENAAFEAAEAAVERQEWTEAAKLESHLWVDGPMQPEGRASAAVRQNVFDMILNNYTKHAHEQIEPQVLQPPAAQRLDGVTVPTLVISGALDETYTNAAMAYLAEHIQGARQVVFPDAAHMVNLEHPARFNAAVDDFLGQR